MGSDVKENKDEIDVPQIIKLQKKSNKINKEAGGGRVK